MAIMVGSFTLQLPTSASVATLLPCLRPSTNHGAIACLVATFLRSVDIGGARLIRDLGGIINT